MLIVFDDDKQYRDFYKPQFKNLGINMDVVECETKDQMRKCLSDQNLMRSVKILVFDLSGSKQEAESLKFEILEDIKNNYNNYAIPIFIHSAYAMQVGGYDNVGTLFRVKKGASSSEEILNKINLFYDSGFLDIFSPGGSIESEIYRELHKAFNSQFKGEEIQGIIESIKHSNPANFKDRTKTVFERIAVRSLYQNMLGAKLEPDTQKIEEIKINAVEHYYRRTSDFPIWTGDIFKNTKDGQEIIILTPRCDINNGYCNDKFLVCAIDELEIKRIKGFASDQKSVGDYLNDNPQNTGYKYRYLIPTPAYQGGRVDLTNYFLIPKQILSGEKSEFLYSISLSDELTNEIVRKFASYIMRSGISTSEMSEASFYSSIITK